MSDPKTLMELHADGELHGPQPLTTISYGGGVQSTAMLVLAANGTFERELGLHVDAALFANVGDDSEHPATLDYVRGPATEYAEAHGIPLHELRRTSRKGVEETLLGRVLRPDYQGIAIPVRGINSGPLTRDCTSDFKIAPLGKWLKANGATEQVKATVLIGISVDEIHRAGNGKDKKYEIRRYPLLDLGLRRVDCDEIIRSAGLPVPRKSSCWFCPFHNKATWQRMKRDEPDLFLRALGIEEYMLTKQIRRERLPVYLWPPGLDTLPDAEAQLPGMEDHIDDDGACDSGSCFT